MKKIIAIALSLVLLLALAGCAAETPAPSNTDVNETFSGGSGTAAAPYQIATADDLWRMAELVNDHNLDYREAYYILTADIDLGGAAWTPIGDNYLDGFKSFPGIFDGDGHTITGLNVTAAEDDETRYFGLFGQVEGTVKNLTVASSTIDCSGRSSATAGAIVGRVDYDGIVENCHVASDVTVTGSSRTGGVAGDLAGTMSFCTNGATVSSNSNVSIVGGVIGIITGAPDLNASSGTVTGCANTGAVTGTDTVGGVVGEALACKIADCQNTAAVNGVNAGGVVGIINAAQTDGSVGKYTVNGCENLGDVTGTEYAGGIVARSLITTGAVSIENSNNAGSVMAVTMGGILGEATTSTAGASLSMTGCVNTGALLNAEADGTNVTGGITASLVAKDGGRFILDNCSNEGAIDAGRGRAGGILGTYLSAKSSGTASLNVNNCVNSAAISAGPMGLGGIVGEVSAAAEPAVTLTVTGCVNSGDLYGNTANVRIGGIVGVIEPHFCTATLTDCQNSGNISCEAVVINKDEEWFDFSAAMGGIVGYVGVNGVSLTPEDDCGLGSTTVLTVDGCTSTGTITTNDSGVEYYTGDVCGLCVVGTDIR